MMYRPIRKFKRTTSQNVHNLLEESLRSQPASQVGSGQQKKYIQIRISAYISVENKVFVVQI